MQKRYIPIVLCIVCAALIALVGYAISTPTQAMPTRILLENTGGKVVFDHQVHASQYKIECQKCHHENSTPRENVQSCGTCHGVTFDETFKTTHAQRINDLPSCVTCHHMEFKPSQWGHDEHSKDYGVDCRSCHHTDTSIEPEPQNCANCHDSKVTPPKADAKAGKAGDKAAKGSTTASAGGNTASKADTTPELRTAVHTKCMSCHQELFDKKVQGCASCHTKVPMRAVLQDTGKAPISLLYTNCQSCHIGKKTDDLILNRMGAFHGSCIKCHEQKGKGPYTKEQCNQCHTK